MNNNTIVKDAVILCIITLIAGLCLGFVHEITADPIAKAEAKAKQEAYQKVFPEASEFIKNDSESEAATNCTDTIASQGYDAVTIDEVLQAVDTSGNVLGHVMSVTTSEGYGGNITISVGVKSDGTVIAMEILSISETAGLGANATKDEFKSQYANQNVDYYKLVKNGNQVNTEAAGGSTDAPIDALSGATITSKAVTKAMNAANYFAKNIIKEG